MPKIPERKELNANSVEILNTIRANASDSYRNMIPYAQETTESIKQIGAIILNFQPVQNEFLNALINRIGMVLLTSKMYSNPWNVFKRGIMEYGETIEEIFVSLMKPHEFDQEKAETNIFKRELPDVRTAFHYMNYTKYYKSTISNDMLRMAFLSWDGITQLISGIIDQFYTSANYDEFLAMKYLLAYHIVNGNLTTVTVPEITSANMRAIASNLKETSNLLEFMSPNYNIAKVPNFAEKRDQYLVMSAKFNSIMDVEVLATSFNMDKAEFMGRRIMVDSFGSLDNKRLSQLFADQPGYTPISEANLKLLDQIPAVLVDKDFWMIFDNYVNFTQQYNGEGLYWNYWYHVWKTLSVSPFANAIVFSVGTPTITAITISPSTATASKGQSVAFVASVTGTNFPSGQVDWTIDSTLSSIENGIVKISKDETASTITVTAKSLQSPSIIGTATITVAGNTTKEAENSRDEK